jgi:uncharacterized LabA/DUF88 family protein
MESPNKTVVYIDGANIILSARNINFEIDFSKLIKYLKDKYKPSSIYYFTGNFKSQSSLFNNLEQAGVKMIYKQIYNENSKTKANCDVEISHKITYDIDHQDVRDMVLLSGDGDFIHIMDFAKREGLRVKVIAADPSSCSKVIKKRDFVKVPYLSDIKNRIINNEKPPLST